MALNNEFKVKNDLNTLGRILSGGTDLATIFSPSNTSWTLSATSGTFGVSGGDTVQFQGDNGVDVRVATGTDTLRISGINATSSVKGVASFHTDNFLVTNGVVTVKDGGIKNAELETATSNNTANYVVVRGASGEFSSGNITSNGTVEAATVNATTGFRLNSGATTGNFLRGNGTNFVSSAILVADVPTLNQSTSGSAATLATTRTLWGQNFNGSQSVSGNLTEVGNITGLAAITIQPFATNQDISLTTTGTGEVNIAKVDIDSGAIDNTTIGASSASTGRFTQVDVDNIRVDANTISSTNTDGDINLTPNGIGDVVVQADTLKIGDGNPTLLTTNGAATLIINTNAGTNSGRIQINQGVNGNIDLQPNGIGITTVSGNLSASSTVTGNAVVASNITATNLLSAASTFTRVLSVGDVQVRTVGTSNVFLGDPTTGRNATAGNHNFVFGLSAGNALIGGLNNVFIGNKAGRLTAGGYNNNFLGHYAGFSNTSGNSNNFFGYKAGNTNSIGVHNNFFGRCAGGSSYNGSNNNFLGNYAGRFNTTGGNNNFLGGCAGQCNTTGINNNFLGRGAGYCIVKGKNNTFIGESAGKGQYNLSYLPTPSDLISNNFAVGFKAGYKVSAMTYAGYNGGTQNNVFIGYKAGYNSTVTYDNGPNVYAANSNNFLGFCAGFSNTSGYSNNFLGLSTGLRNTTGSNNNFLGPNTGCCNTTGCHNIFIGRSAGRNNTTGSCNNFFGVDAGISNNQGISNNFIGKCAGSNNTDGSYNNFLGAYAGRINTSGGNNNFFGKNAGRSNTTGGNNNFLGYKAGCFNTTGSNNIFIGNNANTASAQLSALDGVIVLGTGAVATESNQIVLSTANVVFKNIGSTFEIGTPSLTDNLTVYGAVSSTGIVNTNTGFRISNVATTGNFLRGNGTNFVSSAIQVADVPTLNQSTSGSAATLATTQTLWGQNFNGSQIVSGNLTGVGNITGSGAITIQPFATNQDISLTTSGTGEVNIAKVDIDSGSIDGVSIGTASPATQLIVDQVEIDTATIGLKSGSSATALEINTRSGTVPIIFNGNNAGANAIISSGIGGDLILGTHLNNAANARLTLDDATNGNITFGLNGTGSVVIPRADINAGTIDGTTIGASTASTGSFTQVVVDNITIDGNTVSSVSNGNIDLTPNGTGEVNITKVDIDAGTIDGTAIGASTASTGRFTTLETSSNVIINGNLTVSGSATQINTSNLVISDPIIFLGEGNQADTVDLGFTAAYNHGQAIKRHTGLIRDNSTQQWTLFSNLSTEILSAVQIPLDNPSIQIDTLRANIIGTVTGNLSGMAAQIANGSVSTNSIVDDAVTYAKIQNVSATDKILGRSSAGAGDVEEIACTLAGRNLLDDASASAQRTTLGVGTTDSVTFGEVIVNNGTVSVLNDTFNASSSNNTHTLTTFAKANYNSAKFTIQIKQGNNRCAFEVLATNNNSTWEGTVYALVGADLLDNIDVSTVNTTVDLAFTFKGTATARTMTVYAQAMSD
jgi:hypothetical protein